MKKKFSKKQIAFVLVAICLVGLIGIGISYSYYLANISTSNEQSKNSDISSATITQVVMDMQGKVTSDGAYPGHKMVKEVVVRGIGENNSIPANASIQITPDLGDFSSDVTWKLYKSEEAITCNSTVHTEGKQFYEEATCNIPSSATLELEGGSDSAYKNIVVNPNTEAKYYLVVEYANKETDQSNQMGKSFSIDIELGEKQMTPIEKIMASADTTGKCPKISNDGTANVDKEEFTDGYICTAPDAYGTSYYYRGNVTNNYVKFGLWSSDLVYGYYSDTSEISKEYDSLEACQNASSYNKKCTVVREKNTPMYWRIVRINGDGSVRVIYDGTKAYANGESSLDRRIGTSPFNTLGDDNAYLGYMYGDKDKIIEENTSSGDSLYGRWKLTNSYYIAKEYTFDIKSKTFTLKDPIAVLGSDLTDDYIGYYTANATYTSNFDKIYRIKKIQTEYGDEESIDVYEIPVYYGTSSEKVAQTNKNDSEMKKYLDVWYKNNFLNTKSEQYLVDNLFCNDRSNYYHNGYGRTTVSYHPHRDSFSKIYLKCPQQNDAFTVNDTTNGNGDLTYPIGLVTYDEVALAGGRSTNYLYFSSSNNNFWILSPEMYYGDDGWEAAEFVVPNGMGVMNTGIHVASEESVRPVLNISQEILNKGDGSMNDPYRIE